MSEQDESLPTQANTAEGDSSPKPAARRSRRGPVKKAATRAKAAEKTDDVSPPTEAPEAREAPQSAPKPVARKARSSETREDDVPESFSTDDEPKAPAAEKPVYQEQRNEPRAEGERREPQHRDQPSAERRGPNNSGDRQPADDGRQSHGDTGQGHHSRPMPNQGGGYDRFNKPFGKKQKHKQKNKKFKPHQKGPRREWSGPPPMGVERDTADFDQGELPFWEATESFEKLEEVATQTPQSGEPLALESLYDLALPALIQTARDWECTVPAVPLRRELIKSILNKAVERERPVHALGVLEIFEEGDGVLVYSVDNYRVKPLSTYVPAILVEHYGLKRGHVINALIQPPRENETCPCALRILTVMDEAPEVVASVIPFTELTPYYPLERMLLETSADSKWDNISMRVVDLLTPVGLGQRGLIVAPPRTGKTVLLQGIANAVVVNAPHAHLIVLLVDERPEEVTDFRRQVKKGEVISSTFDESAESHIHAAEMVIEKARRMVECGRHVIILLDSITRLARAYNTVMPNSGKILSGGVEASALQKPKRFFGSARNIEGGGSLTILGTALVETGSRMDEVIFEEFKGTGNMELHLDRALIDKRIFPAISMDRSGTRREELLYHPDEMNKIYSLRRAMKGIPSVEAMEMLIQRVKKTKTNAEFLVTLNR